MDYRLTKLIEQKAFKELTEVEKDFVLSSISKEAYNQQYQILSEVKKDLKDEAKTLKANDQIRINALEALRSKQQKKKSKVIPLWLNYKVPIWTAVAALLLVFILTTPLLINTEIKDGKPTEQLAMQDTLYIERIINDTVEITKPADTIIKTVYASKKTSSTKKEELEVPDFSAKNNNMTQSEKEFISEYEEVQSPINFGNHTTGKSLSEDPVGRFVLNISK